MSESEEDRRVSKRNEVSLPAVVKGRESDSRYWKEQTNIVTVSRLGASFNIERECKAGRVVSLITNMPRPLRCYDEEKKLYRVWGLVQHCSPVFGESEGKFQVGIAFIGKHAPSSYKKDPLKSYRILGMDEDGFWNIGESKTPFVTRVHHRFPCCLEVRLSKFNVEDKESEAEAVDAVTDNISYGGALVFSDLDVNAGDAVRFTCEKYGYSSIAVVRNRQEREGNRTTLHLQFMESNFPIKEIELPYLDDSEIDGTDEMKIMDREEMPVVLDEETDPDNAEGSEEYELETSGGDELVERTEEIEEGSESESDEGFSLEKDEDEDSLSDEDEDSLSDEDGDSLSDEDEDSLSDEDVDSFSDEDEGSLSDEDEDSLSDEDEDSLSDEGEDSLSNEDEDSLSDDNEDSEGEEDDTFSEEDEAQFESDETPDDSEE